MCRQKIQKIFSRSQLFDNIYWWQIQILFVGASLFQNLSHVTELGRVRCFFAPCNNLRNATETRQSGELANYIGIDQRLCASNSRVLRSVNLPVSASWVLIWALDRIIKLMYYIQWFILLGGVWHSIHPIMLNYDALAYYGVLIHPLT